MADVLLTWYQALQLLALGPCLFMLFFLCVAVRKGSQVLVPALYFISLACTFTLPLREALGGGEHMDSLLRIGSSLTPAISFLLIIQFVTGKLPRWIYWGILAVPLVGEHSFLDSTLNEQGELCIYEHLCADPQMLKTLYTIFSSSLTFLLTVVVYSRLVKEYKGTPRQIQHQYALVVALIALNLILLALDLAQITGHVDMERALLAKTVVRIGFIYLVLTSVFRVFDRAFEIAYERLPTVPHFVPAARDLEMAERIRVLFQVDKLYRMMDLSREMLAQKLGINESYLSRVINQCFEQNFNMLINQYRIAEAKERLLKEDVPVTTIAFDVGFSSISSFNRVFKQSEGVSPSMYRNGKGQKS
jgi:AraC-like DNA-binding protein